MGKKRENNKVYLSGEVVSEPVRVIRDKGEPLCRFTVRVPRLSGVYDILPVTILERNVTEAISLGQRICMAGQFRSYNRLENGKSRLFLAAYAQELLSEDVKTAPNTVELNGCLCKPPIYRTTPFGREIADFLLAVNRDYNKSDYIPCIAWGGNARFISMLSVGDRLAVSGRLQSREYQKKYSETDIENRVAYEVSVSRLELLDGQEDEED